MGQILPCILDGMDKDLKNKTLPELEQLVTQEQGRTFDAKYIFSFIHEKHIGTIEEISPLPKSFRHRLIEAGYRISSLDLVKRFVDPDGTLKFLFALPDDTRFEAVLLRDGDRNTLCISSQAGCKMACGFCATGAVGYLANLTGAQIVDQVYQITRAGHSAHNIVYMGMGEPFDNTQEVLRSVRILNDPAGQHIGQRRIDQVGYRHAAAYVHAIDSRNPAANRVIDYGLDDGVADGHEARLVNPHEYGGRDG